MTSLVTLSAECGAAHALATMRKLGPTLARALRRGVPFMSRRGTEVTPLEPKVGRDELVAELRGPVFTARLSACPGGGRALLALDATAIAYILEGSLGGDGSDLPTLPDKGLTAAQHAFVDGVVDALLGPLSSALSRDLGLSLERMRGADDEASAGPLIGVTFDLQERERTDAAEPAEEAEADFLFAEDDAPAEEEVAEPQTLARGKVLIAIAKSSVQTARAPVTRPEGPDGAVVDALREVEVDLVAELGRLILSLDALAGIQVGSTLRLPLAVGAAVDVRIEGEPIFRARPTTRGAQLAVEIVPQRTAPQPPSLSAPPAPPPPAVAPGRAVPQMPA